MLEDFSKMSIEEIVALWEGKGRPVISLQQGTTVSDLDQYFKRGAMTIEHLGVIGDWVQANKIASGGNGDSLPD